MVNLSLVVHCLVQVPQPATEKYLHVREELIILFFHTLYFLVFKKPNAIQIKNNVVFTDKKEYFAFMEYKLMITHPLSAAIKQPAEEFTTIAVKIQSNPLLFSLANSYFCTSLHEA